MNKKYAKLLEAIVSEDTATAEELFHDIVVEASRKIYLEQAEEAFEEMVDEEESIDEDEELDEDEFNEACDSHYSYMNKKGSKGVRESDEELVEMGDMGDDFRDDIESDEAGLSMDDATDDLEGDEYGDDEMGDEYGDEYGDDEMGGEGELEDRVVDLEAELDELKAEFDALMGDEEGDMGMDDGMEDDMGDEDFDDEESFDDKESFDDEDEVDDEMSMDDDEMDYDDEEENANPFESKNNRKKSDAEIMKEYVNVVDAHPGADKKDSETTGDNTKSIVAGPNNMGGTTKNLMGSDGSQGKHDSSAYKMTHKVDDAGNVNVPGGKAAKSMRNRSEGHGTEKKGKGEDSGVNKTSMLRPVRKGA